MQFLLLPNQGMVAMDNYFIPLCTSYTPSKLKFSSCDPLSYDTIIHIKMGVAPENMP